MNNRPPNSLQTHHDPPPPPFSECKTRRTRVQTDTRTHRGRQSASRSVQVSGAVCEDRRQRESLGAEVVWAEENFCAPNSLASHRSGAPQRSACQEEPSLPATAAQVTSVRVCCTHSLVTAIVLTRLPVSRGHTRSSSRERRRRAESALSVRSWTQRARSWHHGSTSKGQGGIAATGEGESRTSALLRHQL